MLDMNNPLYGSLFNMLMSAYGGSGSGVESGFGSAPSGVEGPSMANGGFYSQPQTAAQVPASSGGGIMSTVGGLGGTAVGTYFGGPWGGALGGMVGKQAGSMVGDMLSGGKQAPMPAPPPMAKKPLSRVNPSDQFQIQQAVSSLPPELQQSFSKTFGLY